MSELTDAFLAASAHLLDMEGGWVDHPDDAGGETIFGIARNYHPDWEGWGRVDAHKNGTGFPTSAETDQELQHKAYELYQELYWDPVVPYTPLSSPAAQEVAEELLDQSVHLGPRRAVRHLQRALNILNRRGRSWPDVTVDATLGPQTKAAYAKALERDAEDLLRALDILQGAYLLKRIEARPQNEAFTRGWLRRVFA